MQKSSLWSWDVLVKWDVDVDETYDAPDWMNDKKKRWEKIGEDEGSPVLYGSESLVSANEMPAFPPIPPHTSNHSSPVQ